MPTKKNTKSKVNDNVVSAFVFVNEESDLTFKTRLRNIIQFTFDCLRDNLVDLTSVTEVIRRSIDEMTLLRAEADKRLGAETSKRYHELIEELSAFLQGDENASNADTDMNGVEHYRHYVRIAWFSHFILEDLKKF